MTAPRDIEELLPAYVNGTATADERAAVERALAEHPELEDERRYLAALAEQVRAAGDAPSPGELGWHRLRRSLAEDKKPRQTWWRQALAAAAAIVIVVQGGLLWQAQEPSGGYRPLGTDSGAVIQLRFAPAASAAAIEELLGENGLDIVAGPGAAGIYHLSVADDASDIDALVERLSRRTDVVAFVARE